jgi:hypothetical protein
MLVSTAITAAPPVGKVANFFPRSTRDVRLETITFESRLSQPKLAFVFATLDCQAKSFFN